MFSVSRSEIVEPSHKLAEPERLRLDAASFLRNTSNGVLTVVLMRVGLDLHGNVEGPVPQPWACIHLFPGYMLTAHEPLEVHITPAFSGHGYSLEITQDA